MRDDGCSVARELELEVRWSGLGEENFWDSVKGQPHYAMFDEYSQLS